MRTSLLLLALALCACSDDESRAPLSPGGGPGHQVDVMRPEAGPDEQDDDAGVRPDAGTDGPMPRECERIEPLRYTTDEVPRVTATSSPEDFLVSRQAVTWRDGCESPTLAIELSNGICPNGQGHELEILLSANAIVDGQIGLGLNLIEAEGDSAEGIRVRYTRPERFAPVGTFGTCEGASGQISFLEAPDVSRPMDLRARYEFLLTPCDAAMSNPTQLVSGYFDVRVRRSLPTVCP
jgi:hypothetical protein